MSEPDPKERRMHVKVTMAEVLHMTDCNGLGGQAAYVAELLVDLLNSAADVGHQLAKARHAFKVLNCNDTVKSIQERTMQLSLRNVLQSLCAAMLARCMCSPLVPDDIDALIRSGLQQCWEEDSSLSQPQPHLCSASISSSASALCTGLLDAWPPSPR